jgi:hypothetical protein
MQALGVKVRRVKPVRGQMLLLLGSARQMHSGLRRQVIFESEAEHIAWPRAQRGSREHVLVAAQMHRLLAYLVVGVGHIKAHSELAALGSAFRGVT